MDQKNAEALEKTKKMQIPPSLQMKKGEKIGSAYEDFMTGRVDERIDNTQPKKEEPAKKEPKTKDYDSDETIVSDDESKKIEITPKRTPVIFI